MTTPVKELKGFRKIALEPGETKTVTFTVTPDQLEFLDYNLQPVVEPGEFKVMIGASSQDIRLTGSFMVIDPYSE
jgi:beta-glucosidase